MVKLLYVHVWQQSLGGRLGGDTPQAGAPHHST